MATTHLIELGHRRIAFLAGPNELFVNSVRLGGYRSALNEAGISYDPNLVFEGGFTLDGGRRASKLVMDTGVTGIVGANDLMAIGALRGLSDLGLTIPDDVSVVGIDDIIFTEYAPVPLTTIHVPLADLGKMGARLVMGLLMGSKPESGVTPHHLIRRQSTAPPPSDV